ncbi:ATP--guanido phosphotransferase [uncultured Anaerococcus sp.]|uniref:ATP--guanido phosphotransferase n=1 Tax=uncultured Anaerococcus sp. TaxID=293428 RepID=UPI00280AC149|nr:ATP--guanido phosphotransferase [uncultured Anaerococcus sp.]MDU5149620.1 ATP--guanido phosphotransferase [Anaerococcus prevotii]
MDYSKNIILESNLSIRRNIEGYDFPATMTLEASEKIIEIFRDIYADKLILLEDLDENTKNELINSFVLSEEADKKLAQIGLVIEDDCILTINDRDHLAINVRNFDLDCKKAYRKALDVEEKLDEILDFSFSSDLGYYTQDARNTGSGLEIFVKTFLFAMVDDEKAYYGLKQSLLREGMYLTRFTPKYNSAYSDDVYLIKNIGNYRKDIESYVDKFDHSLDILLRNERRFRRDYMHINKVKSEEIEDRINISLTNLKEGLVKTLDLMIENLYILKKYRILGFDTDFTDEEIDYLIFNLTKNKYRGNRDEDRYLFLREYIKER